MGKNQRHKKVLKSEKAKVKLKTKTTKTKFLPKGANVTDVNFKIKPIVIREQLKIHSSEELLTRRKLSFKDLVTHLNHYNGTVRFEGCEGLLELIQSSPQDVVEQNLHMLLQGGCKLILDKEKKVRHKAIKLISKILEKASVLKISPFFDILISYTTCAMTHIDIAIQEDSLLVIDALLKCTPSLVAKTSNKMLSNFLTLISKLRSESNPARTLIVNLSSRITSSRWRIKVLNRLQGILEAVVQENKNTVKNCASSCVIAVIAEEIGHTIPIYKGIRECPINLTTDFAATVTHTEDDMSQYFNALVPLLHETWAEVVPLNNYKTSNDETTVIEPEAATILSCVIGIFYLLSELVKHSDDQMRKLFLSKHNQKFFNHILNQFPYRQHDTQKQKLKKEAAQLLEINADPRCIRENLLIAYMFCILYKTFPSAHYQKKAFEILAYINSCLLNRNYVTSENIKLLSLTLRIIFFNNSASWNKKNINIIELLDNLVHFHKHMNIDDDNMVDIFNLLSDILQLTHFSRSQKYQLWLSSLPSLLCNPEISEKVVDTLSILSRQNNELFLDALLKQLPEILNNLPLIRIKNNSWYPAHLKIVSMFSYIPVLNREHLQLLKKFVNTNEDSRVASYVRQLLEERIVKFRSGRGERSLLIPTDLVLQVNRAQIKL